MINDASEINCGSCYYSRMIDGVNFCNYWEEDVCLDNFCNYFVNVFCLKDLLNEFFKELPNNWDTYKCMDDCIKEFVGL